MKKLKVSDLLSGENNSNGFGLFAHESRKPNFWNDSTENPYEVVQDIDKTIVKIANRFGFDSENLFHFMNSKLGRWAGDELTDLKDSWSIKKTELIIEKYIKEFNRSIR